MHFPTKGIKFTLNPNLHLSNSKLKFVNKVKYLGVILNSSIYDDDDLNRQVRSFYCSANKLRARFSKCSSDVKNVLYRSYCMSMYACQLWEKYRQGSINRLRIAYNNAFRILHNLPKHYSVREHQVSCHITTFDALLRKSSYAFMTRCERSLNSLVQSLMRSDSYHQSTYLLHYNSIMHAVI